MNLNDFKIKVAAYLNRAPSFFVNNGVDNILEAMNDARRSAQLRYNFNALNVVGFCTLSTTGVNWETGLVATPGGSIPLRLKKVKTIWTYGTGLAKGDQLWFENEISDTVGFTCQRAKLVGTTLYGVNLPDSLPVMVEGIRWLPDLTDQSQADLFLDKGATWLLYQTVQNLNVFLKEDSRVQLADSIVQRAWSDFTAWDGNFGLTSDACKLE